MRSPWREPEGHTYADGTAVGWWDTSLDFWGPYPPIQGPPAPGTMRYRWGFWAGWDCSLTGCIVNHYGVCIYCTKEHGT